MFFDEYFPVKNASQLQCFIFDLQKNDKFGTDLCLKMSCLFKLGAQFDSIITKQENKSKKNKKELRLGAQSSYVVKYFEGSNAVKTTSMRN